MARPALHPLMRTLVHQSAEVQLGNGRAVEVHLRELTTAGLGFECNRETALALLPRHCQAGGLLQGVKGVVTFSLPTLKKPVEAPCALRLCRRVAQDSYWFECRFDPSEHLQQQRVESFLHRKAHTLFVSSGRSRRTSYVA